MYYVGLDWVRTSTQVVHHTVREVDNVIDADHVITADLVEAACLAASGVACLLDAPLQATGVLVGKLQQLLDAPERRHFLVVAGHLEGVGAPKHSNGSAAGSQACRKT